MAQFSVYYDTIVDYNGHVEARSGVHKFNAKDESEALFKANKFFDNEFVLSADAIVEGQKFIAYLER